MACSSCGALPNQECACAAQTEPCGPGPCEDRPFAQLTPEAAANTVANRVMRSNDRARQVLVRLGFRPYNIDLVWSKWTGPERGAGYENVQKRVSLVPNPRVVDLTSINMGPVATGILPMGSIRLERVSGCYTSDQLMGRLLGEGGTPEPWDFYYEVYEDGRSGQAERMKFRPASTPHRRAYGWQITLERISQDADRDGTASGAKTP